MSSLFAKEDSEVPLTEPEREAWADLQTRLYALSYKCTEPGWENATIVPSQCCWSWTDFVDDSVIFRIRTYRKHGLAITDIPGVRTALDKEATRRRELLEWVQRNGFEAIELFRPRPLAADP